MPTALRINLLGGFRLFCDDMLVTALNTPRLQSLLTYLVLHRDAPQPRQYLAFLLWPDSTEAQARTNLRHLIHQLRQALPCTADFVCIDGNIIRWRLDSPFTLDVAEFEQTHAARDFDRAIKVYQGELLPECYDDWILPERERLQQMFVTALDQLVRQKEEAGDYAAAIDHAQHLLRHDPLREETYRVLMRLHALRGDRAGTLRVFHTCASTLQRELSVEPGPATRELYERLLDIEATTMAPLEASFPLVGREREWTQLQSAWRSACARHPQLAILIGEAGIGKTRLADELFTRIKRQGIHTAVAHCYSAEGMLAYAPVVAWLRARPLPQLESIWLSEIARLLPEVLAQHPDLPLPGPLTEAWQRQRLHEALARAILGSGEPLLLWVEDLQWCDRDTLEWLHYLLRFDSHARLLMLGTLRPEEVMNDHPVAALLATLRHDRQLIEITIEPLDAVCTQQLATYAAGYELDSIQADCLYHETEGNPLFIIETLRAGAEPAEGDVLPPTVQAVIATRLAQLSPQTHELMELAATVGREFTFEILRQANNTDEETLIRGLDELWQRRIIREMGASAYDFSHGKLCEVAYAGLSSARRRLLHRRVAEAMEVVHVRDLDCMCGQVAAHYEQAGLPQQASAYYRRAAEAARSVYANDKAIALLTRALELTPADALTQRYDLLLARERVHDLLGERKNQQAELDMMIELAQAMNDLPRQAEARQRQARMFVQTSHFDEAEQSAQAALVLAQQLDDPVGQAAALTEWGNAAYLRGDMPRAASYLQQAIPLAQAAGDARSEAQAREIMLGIQAHTGEHLAAHAQVQATLLLCQKANDLAGYAEQLGNLAALLIPQGSADEAVDACRQAVTTSHAIGYRYCEAYILCLWGQALIQLGQIGPALEQYAEAIKICDKIQEQRVGAIARMDLANAYIRYIGDYDAALQTARAGLALCRQTGNQDAKSRCLRQLGHAMLHKGDPEQARVHLEAALVGPKATGDMWGQEVTHELLAELELAQGRPRIALEHLEIAEALCRQSGLDCRISNVLAGRGEALLALERPIEALAAADRAVVLLKAGSSQAYLVHWQRALVLRSLNQAELAHAALEHARRILSEMLATLSPAQRQLSRERVPEHQAILAAWQTRQTDCCIPGRS